MQHLKRPCRGDCRIASEPQIRALYSENKDLQGTKAWKWRCIKAYSWDQRPDSAEDAFEIVCEWEGILYDDGQILALTIKPGLPISRLIPTSVNTQLIKIHRLALAPSSPRAQPC